MMGGVSADPVGQILFNTFRDKQADLKGMMQGKGSEEFQLTSRDLRDHLV